MIVRPYHDQLMLILQTDHADLSGQFTEAWGNELFARPLPYEPAHLASAEHDNGWKEWEETPKIDLKKGAPLNFFEVSVNEHLPFYLRGVERVIDQDPYGGLLVSMHLSGLYRQRYGTDTSMGRRELPLDEQALVNRFLDTLDTQQKELRERLQTSSQYGDVATDRYIWANYKLLQIWDRLSLYFCRSALKESTLGPVPLSYNGNETTFTLQPIDERTLTIAPYPFRESPFGVSVRARLVPNRFYESHVDFQKAFAEAEMFDLTFEIRRSP